MYDTLLQQAVYAALSPLMTAYTTNGTPRLYYLVAPPQPVKPFAVFQLQSDIGAAHLVGRGGATVLLTVKALADTLTQARTLRDVLMPLDSYGVPALPALAASGYDIGATFERSPLIPYDGTVYQSGHIFRVLIRKI